jgi:hypothetical protein
MGITHVWGRVRRASPREVADRGLEAARIAVEAIRVGRGSYGWQRRRLGLAPLSADLVRARRALERGELAAAELALRSHFGTRSPRFIIDPRRHEEVAAAARVRYPDAATDAAQRADRLLGDQYDLLGYRGLSFRRGAETIDWHYDPVHERRAPAGFWARVPYLDPASGDHKIIWELNRHQHWLALGRAAWLTGEVRYVAAARAELESWRLANPPLVGINWSSMLELAFRAISWMWALHLFLPFHRAGTDCWLLDLLTGLDRQLDHVSRHLSTYFSPNTHLLGEGLALYVAGRALPELASAPRWEQRGRAILLREAQAQVHPDGGHAELSLHYHRYALDFYLLALAIAQRTGDGAEPPLAEVTTRLAGFCRSLADDRGHLPTIGDDDGGLLFPMCGRAPADVRDSLALAAALLRRPELAIDDPPEETFWMLGGEPDRLVSPSSSHPPGSHLFPDTGYAVLRAPDGHAVVDVGRHGFLNGGHAHADALSVVLSIEGRPLLIDPGTATYTMNRETRDRFRSTTMHNTVVVDGLQQSEPLGPFHWHSRADARPIIWRRAGAVGLDVIEGEHDGYLPLLHRRSVVRIPDGPWVAVDHVLGSGDRRMDVYWHLGPDWIRDSVTGRFTHPDGLHAALGSTVHTWDVFRGDPDGLGWCAPVYGRLVPATTLRATTRGPAPLSVVTAFAVSRSPVDLAIESLPVAVERRDGWHRTAAAVTVERAVWLILFATPFDGTVQSDGTDAAGPMLPTAFGERLPPGRRARSRTAYGGAALATDARVAVLRLSRRHEPLALALVEATYAAWSGPAPFTLVPARVPQDMHLKATDLRTGWTCDDSAELPA